MEYTKLGTSGIKVSKVGLGVWQASDEWKGDSSSIIKAVGRASELGVNLLDTAEVYGDGSSERVVAKALKKYGREKFVVATKVYGSHLRYGELQRACEGSLRRLGVKEIDLYQVHWPDPWEQIPLKQTMAALEKLRKEGKIVAIGVSNFAVRDLVEAEGLLGESKIASDQLRYNMLQREIEEEVRPYCDSKDISIIAWSPLAQGVLGGKYTSKNAPKKDVRKGNPVFFPKNLAAAKGVLSVLSRIASREEATSAQVALAWLISKRGVIPIPGAKSPAQAEENARSAEVRLGKEDLRALESAARKTTLDYYSRPVAG